MHLGSFSAVEKLESASCDSYASLVLSNLPHASMTRRTQANHEPIVKLEIIMTQTVCEVRGRALEDSEIIMVTLFGSVSNSLDQMC